MPLHQALSRAMDEEETPGETKDIDIPHHLQEQSEDFAPVFTSMMDILRGALI